MANLENAELGELTFTDRNDIEDLNTMLRRLEVVGEDDIVLSMSKNILSVYGCTQRSAGLLSKSNTILVHRAYKMGDSSDEQEQSQAQTIAPLRSVLDRIARLKEDEVSFVAPVSSVFVSWAGLMPRRDSWVKTGAIASESLRKVAKEGMSRVAELMPVDAGAPVVDKVRRSVWDLEIAPGVPAGAAFALETLGFLDGTETVDLFSNGTWGRISSKLGDVLTKV